MKREELALYLNLNESGSGNYKGYDILIGEFKQDFITYPIINMRFEGMITKEQVKEMKPYLKGLGVPQLDSCGYVIHILCSSLAGKVNEEKFNKAKMILDSFIDYLDSVNIKTLSSCVICRQNKDEEIQEHIVNNNLVLCHKTCFDDFKNYHINKVLENEGNTQNYPKSILFSILGAIVGFLPFIIILLLTNYMLGILFVLIPLAAHYGYKMGKAPLNKKATGIIIGVSAIVMVLGLLGYVGLVQAAQNLLAQEQGGATYSFMKVLTLVIGDIVYCVIFGALGIGWSYRTITKDNNENKLRNLR